MARNLRGRQSFFRGGLCGGGGGGGGEVFASYSISSPVISFPLFKNPLIQVFRSGVGGIGGVGGVVGVNGVDGITVVTLVI